MLGILALTVTEALVEIVSAADGKQQEVSMGLDDVDARDGRYFFKV